MAKCTMVLVTLAMLLGANGWMAANLDDYVNQIGGEDEVARMSARQALRRMDPVESVHKLVPLMTSPKPQVWWAAYYTISDIVNGVSMPGQEAVRSAAAAEVMTLLTSAQSDEIRIRVLRLIPVVVPSGFDVSPVSALLENANLREKARAALEETATPEARTALREYLPKADAAFQVAILNSLAAMHDQASVGAIRKLVSASDAKVRAAAIRAMAFNGDPADLVAARTVLAGADDRSRSDALDGYLRLVNGVVEQGGNWSAAVAAYRDLLGSTCPLAIEAGMAGLGRIGDGTCVAPVIEATKDAKDRTWLIGVDSLRNMKGVDVVRALVNAYPSVPMRLQVALLGVLGGKQHPMTAPILVEAAKSSDAEMRLAALSALGEAGLPESLEVLVAAAKGGSDQDKPLARAALLNLAETCRAKGDRAQAGKAYLAVFSLLGEADQDARLRAVAGMADFPMAEGYEAAKAIAADKNLGELAIRLLTGVADALVAAKQNEKAIELYNEVSRHGPSMEVMQAVARGMAAAGAKVDLQGLLGVVTNWWVVGPFDLGEQNKGWNVDYVTEGNVNLVGRYMSGKRRVQWTPVVSKDPNGKVNLRATVADMDGAIGYAYTEITVKEPTDAVLQLGVDDSEKVWVNGEQVFELWVARGILPDQDKVPVKLKAGANRILLKIWQHTLGWEFCMRITLPDGRPLQFVQKTQ